MLPDWARELLGVGDITAPVPAAAGGGSSLPADRDAMVRINRANVPRGRDAKAQVDVNFSNLSQGARVESKSEGEGMDLGVGRAVRAAAADVTVTPAKQQFGPPRKRLLEVHPA